MPLHRDALREARYPGPVAAWLMVILSTTWADLADVQIHFRVKANGHGRLRLLIKASRLQPGRQGHCQAWPNR